MTDHCGYSVTGNDGEQEPCGRPVAGWRWYQNVQEHEDMLDTACDLHANEGGARIHAAEAEVATLRETLRQEQQGPGWFWTRTEWAEWSNDLARLLPEEYEDDVAQEAIIERAVADLVRRATTAEETLRRVEALIPEFVARQERARINGSRPYLGEWDRGAEYAYESVVEDLTAALAQPAQEGQG